MEGEPAAKRSRLEHHHHGLSDGSSFHMEDLPEEIQHLVLSLLSLKDAARTSLVSRNWRKLWTRHPNLCFDGSKYGSTDTDSVKIERAKFTDTVNSIIQQHSGIGLNKFRVRFSFQMDSDTLNRWICFATASKAKIIDVNLWPKGNYVGPTKQVHHFPLETLGAQDRPFIQCLFLTNVSIKPHSDIRGFTKLRSLHLHCIQIIGDLSGLLSNCSSLEDLEVIGCSGVTDLNIPHPLDKLRHLLISNMRIKMVELHVPSLSHFGYRGRVAIPIVLHGCSELQKATLTFHPTWLDEDNDKVLGHVFHGIPSVSAIKMLHVHANMHTDHPVWSSQVHTLATRPASMFLNLRHLTYEILIFTKRPNSYSGILQLSQYLAFAPQLETLEVHMLYNVSVGRCWRGEGVSYRMPRHDCLKTVYMSGFRCFLSQVELLCGILETGAVLEHVAIEPMVRVPYNRDLMNLGVRRDEICEWARRASERFGKAIAVAERPQQQCW